MISAPEATLIDQLLEFYCVWRAECAAVHTTYEQFAAAAPSERTLAFAAYLAALDREESAAQVYADQIALVSSLRSCNAEYARPAA
ncbi:MAG: hypothetical protein JO372_16770 [Solirubrobacterales bacterium]|nr:hypothetical protein [Solirubrobacterales bacterium]